MDISSRGSIAMKALFVVIGFAHAVFASSLNGECSDPVLPDNVTAISSSVYTDNTGSSSVRVFKCNNGFMFEDSSSTFTARCRNNGEWRPKIPECIPYAGYCNEPRLSHLVLNIDEVSNDTKYNAGHVMTLRCVDRHRFVDDSYFAKVFCTDQGSWMPKIPECVIDNACQNTKYFAHGTIIKTETPDFFSTERLPSGFFHPGTLLTYSCEDSYILKGTSKRICQPNGEWSSDAPKCITGCGTRDAQNRSASMDGADTSWPWFVVIELNHDELQKKGSTISRGKIEKESVCSGVLISDHWIMTTAGCVINPRTSQTLPSSAINARLKNNPKDNHTIAVVVAHPLFSKTPHTHDIALLRLMFPANLSGGIYPACLPGIDRDFVDKSSFINNPRVITGCHLKENSSEYEFTSEYVRILPQENCTDLLESNDFSKHTEYGQCISSYNQNSTLPCKGISGSPVVVNLGSQTNPKWVVEGLVSRWKTSCQFSRKAPFNPVINYLLWIKNYMDLVV